MRHLVLFTLVAGCYGPGSAPSRPGNPTIVFAGTAPGSACGVGSSIGDVAFAPDGTAHVLTLPFVSLRTCEETVEVPELPIDIVRISDGQVVGSAGKSDGWNARPIIAVSRSDARPWWAYPSLDAFFEIVLDNGTSRVPNVSNRQTTLEPVGLVVDGADAYVAAAFHHVPVDAPEYPSIGGPLPTGLVQYSFAKVTGTTVTPLEPHDLETGAQPPELDAPHFICDQPKSCLVQNSTSVFYLAYSKLRSYVGSLPKANPTGPESVIDEIVTNTETAESGLAADDAHVAWSTSTLFDRLPTTGTGGSCRIFWRAASGAGTTETLLDTREFGCRDLELDGDSLYFVIVSLRRFGKSAFPRYLHGEGIGRITVSGGSITVETLDLGITGAAAGPRRVFVRGEDLYFIDPMVVVRIAKSELDGRLDIAF